MTKKSKLILEEEQTEDEEHSMRNLNENLIVKGNGQVQFIFQ